MTQESLFPLRTVATRHFWGQMEIMPQLSLDWSISGTSPVQVEIYAPKPGYEVAPVSRIFADIHAVLRGRAGERQSKSLLFLVVDDALYDISIDVAGCG